MAEIYKNELFDNISFDNKLSKRSLSRSFSFKSESFSARKIEASMYLSFSNMPQSDKHQDFSSNIKLDSLKNDSENYFSFKSYQKNSSERNENPGISFVELKSDEQLYNGSQDSSLKLKKRSGMISPKQFGQETTTKYQSESLPPTNIEKQSIDHNAESCVQKNLANEKDDSIKPLYPEPIFRNDEFKKNKTFMSNKQIIGSPNDSLVSLDKQAYSISVKNIRKNNSAKKFNNTILSKNINRQKTDYTFGNSVEIPSNQLIGSIEESFTPRRSKWGILRSVYKLMSVGHELYNAKTINVNNESLSQQFEPENMKKVQPPVKKNSKFNNFVINHSFRNFEEHPLNKALDDIRIFEEFDMQAAIGNSKSIDKMINLICKAKGSYSRSSKDPRHIVSKKDKFGRSPINIACQNGNLGVVKFLINQGCKLNTQILEDTDLQEEIPFLTACRWNQLNIVSYLLKQKSAKYTAKEIKLGLQLTSSKQVRNIVKDYANRKKLNLHKLCKCLSPFRRKKSQTNNRIQPN